MGVWEKLAVYGHRTIIRLLSCELLIKNDASETTPFNVFLELKTMSSSSNSPSGWLVPVLFWIILHL